MAVSLNIPLTLSELLDAGDEAYAIRTHAAGPQGSLPLTDEMLRNWSSGDSPNAW